MPNRDSNGSGWLLNGNEWLLNGFDGLPNTLNVPNKARQAQYRIPPRWLTPYGTAAVHKSWTDFSTCYARFSTPTASYSLLVDLIMSNTRSPFWPPGAITKTWHSDRRRTQTLRNGLGTYLRNPAYSHRTSTPFHRR